VLHSRKPLLDQLFVQRGRIWVCRRRAANQQVLGATRGMTSVSSFARP
jgi:hypothetical protein